MTRPPTEPVLHSSNPSLPSRLSANLAELSPSCFGMVMATGIVSISAHLLGLPLIARALFQLNLLLYGVLWLLTLLRVARYPARFFGDLIDHLRGPGFFTLVAASGVLGSQFIVLDADYRVGMGLWCIALGLWLVLTYAIFTAFTVKQQKPTLDRGISGGWLLAVVATQSIAVLGALLAPQIEPSYRLPMNFLALSMWLWGGMLYIWIMTLIFYRYTFFRLEVDELSPPYWINMGAMAISTLAGSLLIVNAGEVPFLHALLPFLKGFTVFYWATGTWWIPMLLLLGVWRYLVKRFPVRYDPLYWGAVFPLGMYAACTHEMMTAMEFGFLEFLPTAFLYAALAAWALTFGGLLFDLWQRLRAVPA